MAAEGEKDVPDKDRHAASNETPARRASTRDTAGRSFVIQIAPDCDPARHSFAGRIQHLATYDGGNFDSLDALAAILLRVLARADGLSK